MHSSPKSQCANVSSSHDISVHIVASYTLNSPCCFDSHFQKSIFSTFFLVLVTNPTATVQLDYPDPLLSLERADISQFERNYHALCKSPERT